MATKKTISNTTLNKWNEDDDGKIWRVVERQIKLDKIDIDSWTAAVDQIGTLPVKLVEKKTNLEKIRAFGTTHTSDDTTNEEDRISGTTPEDAAISSAIIVIGQEDINKETVPVDLIEKKTNLERIHLLGTTPGKTTDPTAISIIGLENADDEKLGIDFNERKTLLAQTYITDPNDPTIIKESKTNLEKISILGNRPILLEEANEVEISEKVDDEVTFKTPIELKEMKTELEKTTLLGTHPNDEKEETSSTKRVERESYLAKMDDSDFTSSPVEFKEMKTDLEKTTLSGTHPNDTKEETSSTKRVERESYMAKMDDTEFTSSPVEFKEMKSDLEKTTLSGTNPNDAKDETASAKYVEMEETNTEKIGISKSESFNATHLRSENVYEEISSDVEKSWARHSCPPGFGQMTNQIGDAKTMLNTSMTHPGAGCLRGMDISMDFCGLRYRERREVQWINFYNTTNEAMQDWKVSKTNLPDLVESSKNKISRGKVLLYILSGLLLLLAVALGALCYFYATWDRIMDWY